MLRETLAWEATVYVPPDMIEGNFMKFWSPILLLFELSQEKVIVSGRKFLARHPMAISAFSVMLLSPDGMRGKREGALGVSEGEEKEKDGGF